MGGPTEQDIAFFTSEEAKRIQEEWEPNYGDWVYLPQSEQVRIVTGLDRMGEVRLVEVRTHWLETRDLIFLPRQGQLQAMLEEIAGRRFGVVPVEYKGDEYWIVPLAGSSFKRHMNGKLVNARGPTSSIALGRCLLDVLKEQPND